MFLRLFPAILSFLVLGAHFARIGNTLVVVLLVACIGLLWHRRPWVAYALQTILVLGIIVWILTTVGIALVRIQNGEDWIRMIVIMGGVTVFTGYAAWHFRHPRLRAWYGTDRSDTEEHAADPLHEAEGL